MTWFHWIVEQLSRLRAKKAGSEVSHRVNTSGRASDAELRAGDAQRDAEYEHLEREREERLRSEHRAN